MSSPRLRWAAVVLALAGACALLLATQLLVWWSFPATEVFLTRATRCFDGECAASSLSWLGASAWWTRLSSATYGVGLLAALISVFVAAARAAGRVPRTAAASLLMAVATAIPCAIGTMLTFPPLGSSRTGPGSALYAAGLLLAAVAAVLARRSPK
jgi:hypothetical protein